MKSPDSYNNSSTVDMIQDDCIVLDSESWCISQLPFSEPLKQSFVALSVLSLGDRVPISVSPYFSFSCS